MAKMGSWLAPKRRRAVMAALAVAFGATAGVAWATHAGLLPAGLHDDGQRDMAIDAAERQRVVAAIIDNMRRYYVYPDKAELLAKALTARAARGDFDGVTSAKRFAAALTDALQDSLADRHLMVRYFEQALPANAGGDEPTPAEQQAERVEHRRFNFGIQTVGRLKGNIGYIDVHAFGRPVDAGSRIDAAMALLKDTQALIVDLRHNGGGDPDTVMLMASYLFDQPTHLNDIWMRPDNHLEQRWTSKTVPGPRYGAQRPMAILTSEDTFSAGEDFAYALKYAGRAVLVGEVTGGGAHPGDPRRLDDHFMMNVPSGRTINPVTHTDWEGVGVQPDVKISADKAFDEAQRLLLKKIIANEPDADWRRRVSERLKELS